MESPAKLTLCLRSPLQQRDRNKDTGGCFSLYRKHSLADRNRAQKTGTEPGRQKLSPADRN